MYWRLKMCVLTFWKYSKKFGLKYRIKQPHFCTNCLWRHKCWKFWPYSEKGLLNITNKRPYCCADTNFKKLLTGNFAWKMHQWSVLTKKQCNLKSKTSLKKSSVIGTVFFKAYLISFYAMRIRLRLNNKSNPDLQAIGNDEHGSEQKVSDPNPNWKPFVGSLSFGNRKSQYRLTFGKVRIRIPK